MSQIRIILLDCLILVAVSSGLVGLFALGADQFKQAGKSDPLVAAISQDRDEVLAELLDSGKHDINVLDEHKRNALMRACFANYADAKRTKEVEAKRVIMVTALLKHGAEIDQVDAEDWSSLMWASWSGLSDVVAILLDADASTAIAGHEGYTALSLATMRGNVEVVKLLLAKGADVKVETKKGRNLLDISADGIVQHPDDEQNYKEIISLLHTNIVETK